MPFIIHDINKKTAATFATDKFKMEEVEGFEPPRGLTRLSVFKTDPFSRTWVYLHIDKKYYNIDIFL